MVSDVTCETTSTDTSGHSVVVYIDLWVFISLLLACVVYHFKSKVHLPTSGLLMLAGIFLRCVGVHIGMLKETVEMLDNIEAETILLIFLPALICECAFQTDWYTFKREFAQIILLATTAVIASSFLTAVVIRFVLGYEDDFSWYAALMLGAILSATDHVAVVAQLKEVNADYRLETLIQGETLVNDGTVIVLFTAMLKGATGSATTGGDVVELFFRLSLGGLALGLAFGICLSIWLKRVLNHAILETLLTLVAAYLLFFTADATSVHFSGALGTVTFGLYMSAYGKTMISPLIENSVHEFWSMLGASIEALTLILGGMLMGHFFYDYESLEYADIGMLFALFALIHVVRAIVILLHWPILRLLGYGCSFKDMLVLIFGALKGTISVALSLMVFHDPGFERRVRDLVLFWSVGISVLSGTFDAILMHFVVRVLGLESMTDVEESMLISVTTSINSQTRGHMKKLKKDESYSLANWDEITQNAGPEKLLSEILNITKHGSKMQDVSSDKIVRSYTETTHITDEHIAFETRRRFFTTLKGFYWHLFEHGECFGNSALILIESANMGLDKQTEIMRDWEPLQVKVYPQRLLKALRMASRCCLIGFMFRRVLYNYITEAYDIARNFVRAHEEAEELLDDMEVDIKKEVFEEVMLESRKQIELAKAFLNDHIKDTYPEVFIFVQTKQVSSIILYRQKKSIEDAYKQGIITEIEYEELNKCITRKIEKLSNYTTPKKATLFEMLRSCLIFKDTNNADLKKLSEKLSEEVVNKGDDLFARNAQGTGIFIVLRGRLKEEGKSFTIEHLAGEIVGIQHILPIPLNASSTIVAVTTAKVVFLSKAELERMMANEKFERNVWMIAARKLLAISKESFGEVGTLDSTRLNTIMTNSSIAKYRLGDPVPLHNGNLFLTGNVRGGQAALCFVPAREKAQDVASELTVALQFSDELGKFLRGSESDLKTALGKFELRGDARKGFKIVKKNPAMQVFGSLLTKRLSNIGKKSETSGEEIDSPVCSIPQEREEDNSPDAKPKHPDAEEGKSLLAGLFRRPARKV